MNTVQTVTHTSLTSDNTELIKFLTSTFNRVCSEGDVMKIEDKTMKALAASLNFRQSVKKLSLVISPTPIRPVIKRRE
jgi:hypothetical protein